MREDSNSLREVTLTQVVFPRLTCFPHVSNINERANGTWNI